MNNISTNTKTLIITLIAVLASSVHYCNCSNGKIYFAMSDAHAVTAKQFTDAAVSPGDLAEFRREFFNSKKGAENWTTLPTSTNNSIWELNQKRRLHKAIEDKQYDVVVLPLQLESLFHDKTARLLVAQFVADDIRRKTQLKVMPVDVTHRLLGEQKYRYADTDVNALMKRYNIKYLLSLYLKSDSEDFKSNILAATLTSNNHVESTYHLNVARPDKVNSMSTLTTGLTPVLVDKLFKQPHKSPSSSDDAPFDYSLPGTLNSIESDDRALAHAAYFQLLGILTPKIMQSERKRFFERSLVALRQVPEDAPELATLKSRALFYLSRRPEALELVNSPKSPAQSALRSYLNGNYYDLEKQIKDIEPELLRVFSYIEMHRLATEYEIPRNVEITSSLNVKWKSLINYAKQDNDGWNVPDNDSFFSSLSGLFPDFDNSYSESRIKQANLNILNGKFVTDDLLFSSVLTDLEASRNDNDCCDLNDARISNFDITHFYRTLGLSNILRSLNLKVNKQQLTRSANILFEQVSPLLEGQRTYSRLRAESLDNEFETASEIEKPQILKSLYDLATTIFLGSGVSDQNYSKANRLLDKYLYYSNNLLSLDEHKRPESSEIIYDWPSVSLHGSNSVDYTNSNFHSVARSYDYLPKGPEKDQILQELKSRFNGHPGKIEYLSGILDQQGDELGAENLLRTAVENGTHSWDVYKNLATRLWKKGRFDEISSIAARYPEFNTGDSESPVAISNRAAYVGDLLYWKGKTDQARYFYEIAVDLKTGAYSSMTSAQRLALMDGKIIEAAQIARANAARYNSSYRHRDYISYLHVFGFHSEADLLFEDLVEQFDDYHIWSALFIGDRTKSTNLTTILNAVKPFAQRNERMRHPAQRYIVMQALTDRSLSRESLAKAVAELSNNQPTVKLTEEIELGRLSHFLRPNLRGQIEKTEIPGVTLSALDMNKMMELAKEEFFFTFHQGNRTAEEAQQDWDSRLLESNENQKNKTSLAEVNLSAQSIENKIKSDIENKFNSSLVVDLDYSSIPSRYQLFSNAHYYLKKGDYKKAFDIFSTYDLFYSFNAYREDLTLGSEILPYATISAVEVGKSVEMEAYLKSNYENNNIDTFDYRMSKAVISAKRDSASDAISHLEKAFFLMPHMGARNLDTWYQLLEVCEWIFITTGNRDFIKFALERAQDIQKIHPVNSWSYAFEAMYSNENDRKIRATAIAEYLDKDSNWLKSVPEEIKNSGKEWLKKNNPFDIHKRTSSNNET